LTFILVEIHFLKREYETLFVHRFSSESIPLAYVLRNSGHYWILAGLIFGYTVNHPAYSHVQRSHLQTSLALFFYTFFLLSNFKVHCTLRDLRPIGSITRQIPQGYGFDWPFSGISCPHYFFEVMLWVTIGVWSGCVGVLPFLGAAVYTMDLWAQQKHRKYVREFVDYPNRKAMFPFIR
jgi:very-long-chain enoyl-CoA reductase